MKKVSRYPLTNYPISIILCPIKMKDVRCLRVYARLDVEKLYYFPIYLLGFMKNLPPNSNAT